MALLLFFFRVQLTSALEDSRLENSVTSKVDDKVKKRGEELFEVGVFSNSGDDVSGRVTDAR